MSVKDQPKRDPKKAAHLASAIDPTTEHAALIESIEHALHEAAHLLPEQAPIASFVHHNTLHAFEHLPFETAVEHAGRILGAQPYPSEAAFQRLDNADLLTEEDVKDVLLTEPDFLLSTAELGGLSFRSFALFRLTHLFEPASDESISFQLTEETLLAEFHPLVSQRRRQELIRKYPEGVPTLLNNLWRCLVETAPPHKSDVRRDQRRRDQLLRLTGVDTDHWVHHAMIRLAGAYLDQGIGYWSMPHRERGFYRCFLDLFGQPAASFDRWLAGIQRELVRQKNEQFSAMDACISALQKMRVPQAMWSEAVLQSLLSLRGWAGMFRQFEVQPDKAPVLALPATLLDYLAVLLTLEAQACGYVQAEHLEGADLLDMYPATRGEAAWSRAEKNGPSLRLVYESFVTAQASDLDLQAILSRHLGGIWNEWNKKLDSLTRRKLLLRAFEHHHLKLLAKSLIEHVDFVQQRATVSPEFHAVFCIDDREESYRRHLEEVCPGADTYSFPGFFGVAMRYYAEGEVRHRDLCPVVMKATHEVREISPQGTKPGLATAYHLHVGSGTLLRGFLFTVMGLLSAVPLVLSVLFPRWFRYTRKFNQDPPTELRFAHDHPHDPEDPPLSAEIKRGYTAEEMAHVVEDMLKAIGLVADFAPLVLVVGHGSSSINNPHLAAYGCGATAGGCGGPNARVLAGMANRGDVRALLAERGMCIPRATQFVGGMHDTCTDDVTFYPDSQLTAETRVALEGAKLSFQHASINNAHERCRLFGQVPLSTPPLKAKRRVERRSVDLSEARPEYNHAKNSCCVLGQRKWTRGLFMDQRAFLTSYDPKLDSDGSLLKRSIFGSVPVGMGINLEYFFGTVDNGCYGAGSKLPHNVTGLIAVMDGHSSDLRTGLYAQMVELHEPLRLIAVVQAPPSRIEKILAEEPRLMTLVSNGWIRLLAFVPEDKHLFLYGEQGFELLTVEASHSSSFARSIDVYQGTRAPLSYVHVEASFLSESA